MKYRVSLLYAGFRLDSFEVVADSEKRAKAEARRRYVNPRLVSNVKVYPIA